MLSILLPVYRNDVRQLVQDLHRQATALDTPFEIICLDDGSPEADRIPNRSVASLPAVHYRELSTNVGRSAVRNQLAQQAQYPYLLFLDGDSGVVDDNWLRNYAAELRPDSLLYGGRTYAADPPTDPQLLLHWHYGREREVKTAADRARQPYHGFMTNNYVVPRAIAKQLPFDEYLRHYGHEDTLLGYQLEANAVPILHIDNPLTHLGLEPTDEFLRKQEQAIRNLYQLSRRYPALKTRLLRTYRTANKWRIDKWMYRYLRGRRRELEDSLRSDPTDLHKLDLLKLLWLSEAKYG